MAEQRYCSKCRKTMADTNFYTYKDKTKCELCKSCLTMHINTYDPETYVWIMEKFDVPYIPGEWKSTREKEFEKAYTKAQASGSADPRNAAYNMTKGNGAIFGKYLSKMKMVQFNKYSWADTEKLMLKAEEQAKLQGTTDNFIEEQAEAMKQAFENGEISEAQYMTYMDINPQEEDRKSLEDRFFDEGGPDASKPTSAQSPYPVNDNPFEQVEIIDVGADLTQEDKVYLAMKWGRLYSAADWVALEQLYEEFTKSFAIEGAARLDTLKMICKTSLKMNQAIDCGDIDTYQKLSRVYDAMMKSAKFTEAQRKEEKSGDFDAVGQIVLFAESKKGGGKITRHKIEYPLDVIDETIDKLKRYYVDLVKNETSLGQYIENFIKKREIIEQQKQDMKEARAKGYDTVVLSDEDYTKYYDDVQEQKENDIEYIKLMGDEE